MKNTLQFGAVLGIAALVIGTASAEKKEPAESKKTASAFVHVVIFQLKKDAPTDAVEQVIKDCHAMLAKIPSVHGLRVGRPAEDGTPELAKKDFDIALLILCEDAAGLKAYLEHPQHVKFVEKHGKFFDMKKLQVFDFMNQTK
jgi:hypothetical protein